MEHLGEIRIHALGEMKKRPTVSQLKKRLDALVSRFVRLSGNGTCYTCGFFKPKLELQCGHFVSRQYNATRYDLDNLRPQCYACNVMRRGNTAFFADNLLKELGRERFDALIKRGRSYHSFTVREVEGLIAEFTEKLSHLQEV